jgi:hypothetical protein
MVELALILCGAASAAILGRALSDLRRGRGGPRR